MTRSCVYVGPGFSYGQHMVGQTEACGQATLREGKHLRDYPTIVADDTQKAHVRTSPLVESLQIEFQVAKFVIGKLGDAEQVATWQALLLEQEVGCFSPERDEIDNLVEV